MNQNNRIYKSFYVSTILLGLIKDSIIKLKKPLKNDIITLITFI